jgi:4-hydroxy-tetrahydrodipicolinate synthase
VTRKPLKGVIPALITPMREEGNIDYKAMQNQVEYLAGSGVEGFFINGTTSEGPILSRPEKKESVRIVKELSAGRQAICAACIAPAANLVIEEIHELEPLEPDYIVCVAPYYFSVGQEVILEHFEQICRNTEIPVIFYDIPQHTHNPIALETRRELVRRDLGVGFKDSTGDFAIFSRSVLECRNDEFVWIQGDDLLDAYSVIIGARGIVTGLSNITPAPYVELFRLVEEGGDDRRMIALQHRINSIAGVISAANGRVIAGIKATVAYLGRCEPWLRMKGLTATQEEAMAVREVVDSMPEIGP